MCWGDVFFPMHLIFKDGVEHQMRVLETVPKTRKRCPQLERKPAMKMFALSALYVFSIVLALGIGTLYSARDGMPTRGGGGDGHVQTPTCADSSVVMNCTSTANKYVGGESLLGEKGYKSQTGSDTYCKDIPASDPESHGKYFSDPD